MTNKPKITFTDGSISYIKKDKKLDLGNHLKLIDDANFKGKSIRGDDNKFTKIDDQLYALIEKALEINTDNWSMNGDKELFDWYCEIRNKLCKKIDKKIMEEYKK